MNTDLPINLSNRSHAPSHRHDYFHSSGIINSKEWMNRSVAAIDVDPLSLDADHTTLPTMLLNPSGGTHNNRSNSSPPSLPFSISSNFGFADNKEDSSIADYVGETIRAGNLEGRCDLGCDYCVQPSDVVMTVNGSCNAFHHRSNIPTGNRRLLVFIEMYRIHYRNASKRSGKSNIIRRVASMIRECGGNFVQQDNDTSDWYDVGNIRACYQIRLLFRYYNKIYHNFHSDNDGSTTSPLHVILQVESSRCSKNIKRKEPPSPRKNSISSNAEEIDLSKLAPFFHNDGSETSTKKKRKNLSPTNTIATQNSNPPQKLYLYETDFHHEDLKIPSTFDDIQMTKSIKHWKHQQHLRQQLSTIAERITTPPHFSEEEDLSFGKQKQPHHYHDNYHHNNLHHSFIEKKDYWYEDDQSNFCFADTSNSSSNDLDGIILNYRPVSNEVIPSLHIHSSNALMDGNKDVVTRNQTTINSRQLRRTRRSPSSSLFHQQLDSRELPSQVSLSHHNNSGWIQHQQQHVVVVRHNKNSPVPIFDDSSSSVIHPVDAMETEDLDKLLHPIHSHHISR